jgi:hypothetical protein
VSELLTYKFLIHRVEPILPGVTKNESLKKRLSTVHHSAWTKVSTLIDHGPAFYDILGLVAFCNIRDIELPAIMVEENIFVKVKVLLYGSKTQIEEVEFT